MKQPKCKAMNELGKEVKKKKADLLYMSFYWRLSFQKGFESLFLKGNRGDRLQLMLCPLTSNLWK